MDKIRVFFSNGKEIKLDKGSRLSKAFEAIGLKKDFPCAGMGKCGQCKTDVALIGPGGRTETAHVSACSYTIEADIWVQVEEDSANPLILTSGALSETSPDPGIVKVFIPGGTADSTVRSYWDRFKRCLTELEISQEPTLGILRQFSVLSSGRRDGGFTLVASDNKIICLERGDTTGACYGLAVDVGTTTVVVYLLNLINGQKIGVGADLNGQRIFGADVISRISSAAAEKENLSKLQLEVINTINGIIKDIVTRTGISPAEIYSVTIAGNTCMHHLLLGLEPSGLGRAPFLPVFGKDINLKARELGLEVNPEADVWFFPVIAGFVGGDTVAAIIATGFHRVTGNSLMIDIGTNSEMVINARGKMVACSAAAGPALEGAQIECGMRAENGAINKVKLAPDVHLEVIGGGFVKGICGSGLIDLLAEMIRAKLIDSRGKLAKPDRFDGPEYLRQRILGNDKGYRFVLVYGHENKGKEIFLSQKDISQIQLAKGANRASVELLVDSVGINGEEIDEVLVAGAFGNYMDIGNAVITGLLPGWAEGKVRLVGNAAGEGAKAALLSREKRIEAAEVTKKIEFLELAGTARFQEAFIKGMLFEVES